MLGKIGQIAINVHDLDRATAFYRDALGLTFLFAAPRLAFFQAGEQWLMLGPPDAPEFDHPSSILYFDVEDILAAHRTLVSRGVVFRTEPHVVHRQEGKEMWLADFRDTEGNTHCLRCWKPAA
jgi:methylmalonyl-CoA/ethylmalonyl-CoA epimerase